LTDKRYAEREQKVNKCVTVSWTKGLFVQIKVLSAILVLFM